MQQVDAQGGPLVEGVGDRLAHGTLGQHRSAVDGLEFGKPFPEVHEDGRGEFLAQSGAV